MNEFVFAPLIETYREGAVCPSYACLYSSVLSLLQKPVNVSKEPVNVSKGQVTFQMMTMINIAKNEVRYNVFTVFGCGSRIKF